MSLQGDNDNLANAGIAQIGANANMYNTDAQKAVGLAGVDAQKLASRLGLQGVKYGADTSLKGQLDTNLKGLEGTKYGADTSKQLGEYQSNQQLKGTEEGYANEQQLQKNKIDFANKRFDDIFGENGFARGIYGGTGASGDYGLQPVTQGGLFSDRDVQGQVNSGIAGNDQRFAGMFKQAQGDLASRGLGQESPLLQQMHAYMGAQNQAANNDVYRNTTYQARQGNADTTLKQQQAQIDAQLGAGGLNVQKGNAMLALLAQLSNPSL